jgi:spore coat protein U-like protein
MHPSMGAVMKSMFKKLAIGSAFGLVAMMGGEQAEAATDTATLAVSATVSAFCELSTNPVNFGAYDPAVATDTSTDAALGNGTGTAGSLAVDCTQNVNFTLTLDAGANPGSGASGAWAMGGSEAGNAGSFLGYDLFFDADGAGAGVPAPITAGTSFVSDTGNGYVGGAPDQLYEIDGVIGQTQSVAGGQYDDTVTATLTF